MLPQTKSSPVGLTLSVASANPNFSPDSTFAPLIPCSPLLCRGPASFTLLALNPEGSLEGLDPIPAACQMSSSRAVTHAVIPSGYKRGHPDRRHPLSSRLPRVSRGAQRGICFWQTPAECPAPSSHSRDQSSPAKGNRYSSQVCVLVTFQSSPSVI